VVLRSKHHRIGRSGIVNRAADNPRIGHQATLSWLRENRQHRMDALDDSGIFPLHRQVFHRARYEFAKTYVKGRNVVDIACGLGYGSRLLKDNGAKTVIGIDLCEKAVAYARSQHSRDGVTFTVGDATRIPLRDSSVDVIMSFETIEHVSNTIELLAEFLRVLRRAGHLIISSPTDWGLTDYHCHTWTPFEFMAEIAAVSHIESVWKQNSNPNGSEPCVIERWTKETEVEAECIMIVARKIDARYQLG
jgi:ubiquinone/menaquinone biosynthesis C-methylase UbiE